MSNNYNNVAREWESTFARFFSSSISGSILLILSAALAIVCANTNGLAETYEWICNQPLQLNIGGHDILSSAEGGMTIAKFVNDGLMAIFFFAVGLEIKREMLIGELSNFKHALLPIIGAIGGMVVPVAIFYAVANGSPAENGLAIPMATDIAFSLGVLSLLGKRVPVSLKIFLTALAVADDLGGILVIALFYSHGIHYLYLLVALALMIILYVGARSGINNRGFYLIIGVIMWFMFLYAGIHPTMSGVICAFFVPARPKIDSHQFLAKLRSNLNRFPPITQMNKGAVILNKEQRQVLHKLNNATNRVISPLQKIEDLLHPIVAFFIIPVFGFINAGIEFDGMTISTLASETTMGIVLGLLVGKFVGIYTFSYIAIKTKIVLIPTGVTLKQMAAVSIIGGIGFTVSLFIADLSYTGIPEIGKTLLNEAKLGIVLASIGAAVLGYYALKLTLPKPDKKPKLKHYQIEGNN